MYPKKVISLLAVPAILISTVLVAVIVSAWTEPAVAPPGGNASSSITISSVTQYKAGALGLGGLFYLAPLGIEPAGANGAMYYNTAMVPPKFRCYQNGAWTDCVGAAGGAGDITEVLTPAGSGLTGGQTSGSVSLGFSDSIIQRRVTGTCAAGSSISSITAAGAVTCETDDVGGAGGVGGSGTGGYIPKWTGAGASTNLGNSLIQDTGTAVGINKFPDAGFRLDVSGQLKANGIESTAYITALNDISAGGNLAIAGKANCAGKLYTDASGYVQCGTDTIGTLSCYNQQNGVDGGVCNAGPIGCTDYSGACAAGYAVTGCGGSAATGGVGFRRLEPSTVLPGQCFLELENFTSYANALAVCCRVQ